jgi:tRNA 2-thiouridine synthesizing protein A
MLERMLELNARQLLCPMPVIRLQNAINRLEVGDQVKIFCTDRGTKHDIPTWCRINGHTVISQIEVDNEIHFVVQKG